MFKNWIDVTSGKMSLDEVMKDIRRQIIHHRPKRIIIDIKLKEGFVESELNGYHTEIWISKRDFIRRR